jgi:hypothetical protein
VLPAACDAAGSVVAGATMEVVVVLRGKAAGAIEDNRVGNLFLNGSTKSEIFCEMLSIFLILFYFFMLPSLMLPNTWGSDFSS